MATRRLQSPDLRLPSQHCQRDVPVVVGHAVRQTEAVELDVAADWVDHACSQHHHQSTVGPQLGPSMGRVELCCIGLGWVELSSNIATFTDRISAGGNAIASVRLSVHPFVSSLFWQPTDR